MTWFDNQDSITQIVTTRSVADLLHHNDAIVCAIALLHDPGIDRDRVLNVLVGIMLNRHISGASIETERLTGEVGQAFSFDGSTGYVSVQHNANQNIQNAITIDAWIMKKGNCTNNCIIVMKQISDGTCCDNLRYGILVIEPSHQIDFAFNNGSWTNVVLSNTTIQDNVWYHIAGTYDSNLSIAKVYINGVLDNSALISGPILPSTSGNLYIGRDSTQNS